MKVNIPLDLSTKPSVVSGEARLVMERNAFATAYSLLQPGTFCLTRTPAAIPTYGTLGAVYDQGGALVRASVRDGGNAGDRVVELNPHFCARPKCSEYVAGRTLYLGPFMAHYGHFITEGLSRCWLIDQSGFDKVAFYPFIFGSTAKKITAWHEKFFEIFGIHRSQITIIRSETVFEEIWIPEQLWKINRYPSILAQRIYHHVRSKVPACRSGKPVFMTLQDKSRSRIKNLNEVESALRKKGFDIIIPENMSLEDQVGIYSSAKVVVGLSGSAMHNCVFASPGSIWIELGDPRAKFDFIEMQKGANIISEAIVKKIPFIGKEDKFDVPSLMVALDENLGV